MKDQNYSSHRRFVPMYHFVMLPAMLVLLIGSVVNLIHSSKDNLYSASLLVLSSFLLLMAGLFIRFFALKAQDRAIVAEERFRYYLLTSHYRKPFKFSFESLDGFCKALKKIDLFAEKLNAYKAFNGGGDIGILIDEAIQQFNSALDDDFNTPQALAILFEIIRKCNAAMSDGRLSITACKSVHKALKEIDCVLGILQN